MLRLAEAAGYDVLLTIDRGIPHQHSSAGRMLSIVVIVAGTNQVEDLTVTADLILTALETIRPGQVLTVSLPD